LNTGSELRFPSETRDRSPILPELFSQHLQCDNPVLRMVSTVDRGGSTLPDHVLYAVPGKRGTHKRIARHAANLILQTPTGKRSPATRTKVGGGYAISMT